MVTTDEGVRGDTTAESLGGLRPAFDKAGNITAGNASQISDGGAAVDRHVEGQGRASSAPRRSARSSRYGQVAGPDPSLLHQPARAIKEALDKAGKSVSDVDLFELNEAFAAVGLASMAELGITDEITNVNGGAIALGHPIGMSGHPGGAHHPPRAAVAAAAVSVLPRCAAAAARATRSSCSPSPEPGGLRARSGLDVAATFEGPAEGQLVGVLEVATHGQAAGDAGDPDAERG